MAGETKLKAKARREKFREIIERDDVTRPASIFDPVSARLAELAGFELGVLGSSVASHVVLGAPEIDVITLSEVTEQVRRIARASTISFFVDADHGYGNALNVMRTIEDIENAGAAAVSIEDTKLPRPFGSSGRELISVEEFEAKMKAAVAAREDASFGIIGRTMGLSRGVEETNLRIAACERAGVDGVFLAGNVKAEDLAPVADATKLPLLVFNPLDPELLRRCHVRIAAWNHLPFRAAIKAMHDAYAHTFAGLPSEELRERATDPEIDRLVLWDEEYKSLTRQYLT